MKYFYVIGIVFLMGWLFFDTWIVNQNEYTIRTYADKVDSLETRIERLEHFADCQPDTIVINIYNTIKK